MGSKTELNKIPEKIQKDISEKTGKKIVLEYGI